MEGCIALIVLFLTAVLVLFVFNKAKAQNRKPDGVLRINTTDPEKDTYVFEIDDLYSLDDKDYLILKIERE